MRVTRSTNYDVLIIGAGFAGLCMLHHLRKQLGLSVKVVEAGSDVGGTWYWNRYPGARCDTESYVYCYSFSKELLQEWNWSGRYPEQRELLAYLRHFADRFNLRRDIQFDTRIVSAHFESGHNLWRLTTDSGEVLTATFLVNAVGLLSRRYTPDIKGIESFKGEWHHTSAWPEREVEFEGKRVGVIGTGSTGVQSVSTIAKTAKHLTVFQRTAQYAIPARHERVDRAFLENVKQNYDEIWAKTKNSSGGFPFQHNGMSALDVSDEARLKIYEELWAEGGVKFLFGSFRDLLTDARANDTVSEFIRSKIREEVKDPDVAEVLIPKDHPFGSRRPIIHTDYFQAFNRSNVTLVDARRFPIQEITQNGIRVANGDHDLDIIVFATGFDAVTGAYMAIDIRGLGGLSLKEKWKDRPLSYLGIATSGFPNMFMVQGPGSTFGNQVVAIEHHVEWITRCIQSMRQKGVSSIDVTRDAELEWSEEIRQAAERTVVVHADSWFNGGNIPGKVRCIVFYPGSYKYYRKKCDEIARDDYRGFTFHGRAPLANDVKVG
jgi:cation diffusion facilitator CzcD-associated flavoprotein CzcO